MIVKYLDGDVWGYIDNVRQAASVGIDCEEMVGRYDECPNCNDEMLDTACYLNGQRLSEDVCISNKVFSVATGELEEMFNKTEFGHGHAENLLDGKNPGIPAYVVLLYLNDHREYDTLALVTNQKCFLMNDKGQTIERLV